MTTFHPLPSILLNHTLSDLELQEEWVRGARDARNRLAERVRTLEAELEKARNALFDAERFLREAEVVLERHRANADRPRDRQHPRQDPHVAALFQRRSPEEVEALLAARAEREAAPLPPAAARLLPRPGAGEQRDDVVDVEFQEKT